MKTDRRFSDQFGKWLLAGALLMAWLLTGCTAINPKPEQLQLPVEPPEVRETNFSAALTQLGIQSEIYGASLLKIQTRDLDDVTGTSYHTRGEIPKSITVMVKSALNSIGGQVVYIPYWPDYIASIHVSGYPVSNQKLVPDVILAGGITEFDRGLTSLDRTRDFDVETKDIDGAPDWFNNKRIGLDYSKEDKWNKAKIAVDFNLVSYEALCGIPKMQASNGITVYKGITEEELGFTLFGPTIGLRGSVKKVQGRHNAVRLLVQFSVIQLVGRYLDLPYWLLLDSAEPDPVVMQTLKSNYRQRDFAGQILTVKRLLWIHDQQVPVSGDLDAATRTALAALVPELDSQSARIPVETYLNLYLSVPLTADSIERGKQFDRILAQAQAAEEAKQAKKKTKTSKPKKKAVDKKKQPVQKGVPDAAHPKAEDAPAEAPKPEIIIITPLDSKTGHSLKSIIQRIEGKKFKQNRTQRTPVQSVLYKSRIPSTSK
jgi:hypothetical protein